MDDDGFIVAAKLTKSSEDDPSTVPCLLEQVDSPIRRFTADGAYDTRSVYELLGEVGTADIKIVIPPRFCLQAVRFSSLIDCPEYSESSVPVRRQTTGQPQYRLLRIRDQSQRLRLGPSLVRYRDRFLVTVQSHLCAIIFHDPSSLIVALCFRANSSTA